MEPVPVYDKSMKSFIDNFAFTCKYLNFLMETDSDSQL